MQEFRSHETSSSSSIAHLASGQSQRPQPPTLPTPAAPVYSTHPSYSPSLYAHPSQWQTGVAWPASSAFYVPHPVHPQPPQYHASYQYATHLPNSASTASSAAPQRYTYPPSAALPGVTPIESQVPAPSTRELPRSWDLALKAFIVHLGFSQTLKGFESDILVMNSSYEEEIVPYALEELRDNLSKIIEDTSARPKFPDLDQRKLEYIPSQKGTKAQTPTSVNRLISQLLARNRARNNASNRAEFLHATKRRRLSLDEGREASTVSAARADAKPIDRDMMMKFDIAKNEEGPLRRTVQDTSKRDENKEVSDTSASRRSARMEEWTSDQYPGLSERLKNLETHLAVRYVPSAPITLLHRLQLLEEHIINLEREYPPWAALFFNQPRRGWPPPPRATPLIVQSHLASRSGHRDDSQVHSETTLAGGGEAVSSSSGDIKGKGRAKSSLHRAVMDRLEVQRAMVDLKGQSEQ